METTTTGTKGTATTTAGETPRTYSIGDANGPHVLIIEGHIDQKAAALLAEGFDETDLQGAKHEYWTCQWTKADNHTDGAIPVTVIREHGH